MKVETQETSSSTYTLTIELPVEQVSEKIQAMFRQVAHEVNVPGFRKGKVPRGYLENMFGKDFLDEDVQNALIEEALPVALAQKSLRPLSKPQTRVTHFKEGDPFTFEVDIEVLPTIEFPDLSSVQVEAEPDPVPQDDDVERILEDLRVQHATLVPKAQGAQAAFGDVVVVALPNGSAREILLNEDSDLSKQLVGQEAGATVDVRMQERELALTVAEIKDVEKPDLAELASTLDKDSEAELLDDIQSQLQERLDQEHRQKMRYKVLDAIIAAADVPVPPRLKDEVIEHELDALARSGRVGALSDDDRSAYAEGAEERLKREVALESLKRQNESFKLSDEAFDKILEEAAEAQNMNPVKFKALLERENSLQRFRSQKEDERLLDYLFEQVDIKTPKSTGGQTTQVEAESQKEPS